MSPPQPRSQRRFREALDTPTHSPEQGSPATLGRGRARDVCAVGVDLPTSSSPTFAMITHSAVRNSGIYLSSTTRCAVPGVGTVMGASSSSPLMSIGKAPNPVNPPVVIVTVVHRMRFLQRNILHP